MLLLQIQPRRILQVQFAMIEWVMEGERNLRRQEHAISLLRTECCLPFQSPSRTAYASLHRPFCPRVLRRMCAHCLTHFYASGKPMIHAPSALFRSLHIIKRFRRHVRSHCCKLFTDSAGLCCSIRTWQATCASLISLAIDSPSLSSA